MITLDGITLPPYLKWEDEISWTPVDQSTEYFLAGTLDIEVSIKQNGRHITLVGDDNRGWITWEKLHELQTLFNTPEDMALSYHGQEFTVRGRYENGESPVTAEEIIKRIPPHDSDPFRRLKIKLIVVA